MEMDRKPVLLDIDNCISDDGWRISFIDWRAPDLNRRYHEYLLRAPWDVLANADLVRHDRPIIFFTSRPLNYRGLTVEWLSRQRIQWQHLLMRNDNDQRSSLSVKRWQLEQLVHYDVDITTIHHAYDDRPEIVEMYRTYGISASVRAIHSACAYVNPLTGHNHCNGEKAKQA